MSEVQSTTPSTPISTVPKPIAINSSGTRTNSNTGQRRTFGARTAGGSSTSPSRVPSPTGSTGERRNASNRNDRNGSGNRSGGRPTGRNDRRPQKSQEEQQYESKVIEVRRVTRVVKGGKRMRFSALVVVGDRNGKVGFGLKKGQDFADAVAKATKKATGAIIKVTMDKNKSVSFASNTKHKSSEIFLKPATQGIGLIAGGFVRPVLELAGIENVYTKINRSRNKIPGVQCVIKALLKYSNNK